MTMDRTATDFLTPHRSRCFTLLLCVLTPLATPPPANAADSLPPAAEIEQTAVQLREQAMRGESVAWEFVSELTTRIGPRPAGSPAEQAAAAWAAKKLKEYGFDDVRVEDFPMTGWVRGVERGEIVAPSMQPLAVAALGGAPPTRPTGVEGEVVLFPTYEALMTAPAGSLAGKIAVVTQRTVRSADGDGYVATGNGRRSGPIEAAKRGAVAYMLRSLGTDSHRFPHTGGTRFDAGKVPIPAFALSNPDVDQLERLAALGEKVRVRLFSTASYVNTHSQNVIADIRGDERPDEVIVLGAHLDSWDLGTGAIDDAAGCAIVTAAAKLIGDMPNKPRRTVRVVLFGSEEVSQPDSKPLGGPSYVLARKANLGKHVITGESDFGADRVYAVALPSRTAESPFGRSLMRVLTPIGVLPSDDPPGRGGADVGPMVDEGVPAFLLKQDGTNYFDLHHTADDTLDKIDKEQLSQNVAAWVSLTWLVAESDVDFRALASRATAANTGP
jgi:carboxypeptidase Q